MQYLEAPKQVAFSSGSVLQCMHVYKPIKGTRIYMPCFRKRTEEGQARPTKRLNRPLLIVLDMLGSKLRNPHKKEGGLLENEGVLGTKDALYSPKNSIPYNEDGWGFLYPTSDPSHDLEMPSTAHSTQGICIMGKWRSDQRSRIKDSIPH